MEKLSSTILFQYLMVQLKASKKKDVFFLITNILGNAKIQNICKKYVDHQ